MKDKKVFCNRGRTWSCSVDKKSGFWMATSSNPEMLIQAETWELLKDELSTVDITISRIDGVAVVDSLCMGVQAEV